MTPNLGLSTSPLALVPDLADPGLIDHLNHTIRPQRRLSDNDVYIRALLVCSTAVNAYGGRFAVDDLPHIGELLVDSPVLIGHRKDTLPIARIFYADIVERDGAPWVRAWCYWLKSVDSSGTLRDNIDGGVYKECSLSFTYHVPECSICGKDIRLCGHEPFTEYNTPSGPQVCHFVYRRIDRVLETSLVYRGAVANTAIENPVSAVHPPALLTNRLELNDLDMLSADSRYLITPAYDGIPVSLSLTNGRLVMRSLSDDTLPENLGDSFTPGHLRRLDNHFGLLVGYNYRTRCSLDELRHYLRDSALPVNRLVVHLFPHPAIHLPLPPASPSSHSLSPVSYRIAGAKEIPRFAPHIMSKLGIDLWPLGELPPSHPGWRFCPSRLKHFRPPRYTLTTYPGHTDARLMIEHEKTSRTFVVHQFNLRALLRGARLICDPAAAHGNLASTDSDSSPIRTDGDILQSLVRGDGISFTASAPIRGTFVIRPVLLAGRTRYLLYRRRPHSH